jgi:selenocysteine-specific elongation factor
MIVATAGHIDHGKTSLVKALTGIDTDRLPEERARGISINLGFAHADLAPGARVSFIDVPGHERFIRNMLAGVSAVEAALLVVAADDGVMPQTTEHLHILDLLDVRCGAAVITKTDLVSPERVVEVVGQVQALLEGTSLAGMPVFPTSARTRAGLDAVRDWLAALPVRVPALAGGHFRLSVDRAFTVAGSGTVVTGTVVSGTAAVGDHLVVSPSGREVRVRALRVQDAPAAHALQAQRCALNLSGLAVEQVGRGDWVVAPALHAPTHRIDARLNVLSTESAPLAHWTPVHLHIGTADIPARISVSGEAAISAGCRGFVQLVLDRPVPALHGDRFVVRDQSAQRTIGGGVVLDPFAPKRQRRAQLRMAELQMLERDSAVDVLRGLLEITETGVDLNTVARNLNLTPDRTDEALREAGAMVVGKEHRVGISRTSADVLLARTLSVLAEFHATSPQLPGVDIPALRALTATRLSLSTFQSWIRELANRQHLVLSNDLVRLADHEATANPQDEQLWERVRRSLDKSGVNVPLIAELAQRLQVPPQVLRDFLHRKSRTGAVLRVAPERFALRETLARVGATAVHVARRSSDGFFAAADLRDAIGTGRGLAIHYLEFFDRLGITQRFGDRRRIARDYSTQLGAAEPFPIPTKKAT